MCARESEAHSSIDIIENDLEFPGSEWTSLFTRISDLIEASVQDFQLLKMQENLNHNKLFTGRINNNVLIFNFLFSY